MWQISPVTVPDDSIKGASQLGNAHLFPDIAKRRFIVVNVGVDMAPLEFMNRTAVSVIEKIAKMKGEEELKLQI